MRFRVKHRYGFVGLQRAKLPNASFYAKCPEATTTRLASALPRK
jgi:hypothetical protein